MVRFSCFNAHIHRHRPKKSIEGFSERLIREDGSKSKELSSVIFGRNIASGSENSKPTGSTVIERVWKSEEIKPSGILEHGIETHQVRRLKKSQSHGDELYLDGRDPTENETDSITSPNSLEQSGSGTLSAGSNKRIEGSPNLFQKAPGASVSVYQGSDQALNGSIFSVGGLHHADKDSHQFDDTSFSGEQMDNSNSQTPDDSPLMVRSNSVPNIADSASGKSSPKYSSHHSRSSDDLHVLDMRQTHIYVHKTDMEGNQKQDQDQNYYDMHISGDNNKKENVVEDRYDDAYDYSSLAKDWMVPPTDERKLTNFIEGEPSNQQNFQERIIKSSVSRIGSMTFSM